MNSKFHIWLGVLLAFVAVGALPAGYSMITQPDGSGLGMNPDFFKENALFSNFFVPGLFLFFGNGLAHLAAAIMCFLKKPLSGKFAMMLGIYLMIWITIQIFSIRESSFMQPLFFVIGLIEFILGRSLHHKLNPQP